MIDKQSTGFKFGKYQLQAIHLIGEVPHNGRTYRMYHVRTQDGLDYNSTRLYKIIKNHFLKQLCNEPEICRALGDLFYKAADYYDGIKGR